jgi:hypothetical protein
LTAKDEFDAGRDAEFLEDVEEIFLDGVLAKVEFAGNLAVAQAFGDQRHYLFLAWRKQAAAEGVEHAPGT